MQKILHELNEFYRRRAVPFLYGNLLDRLHHESRVTVGRVMDRHHAQAHEARGCWTRTHHPSFPEDRGR